MLERRDAEFVGLRGLLAQAMKTGALIRAAVMLGALCSDSLDAADQERLDSRLQRLEAQATGLAETVEAFERALIAAEIIVGTSGIGFLMFDARRAGSVVEILLGMIVLGLLWYIVDSWVLAPIERATGQRWGLVTQ